MLVVTILVRGFEKEGYQVMLYKAMYLTHILSVTKLATIPSLVPQNKTQSPR